MSGSQTVRLPRTGYAVSAEFYDVLQAPLDAARVRHLYGHDVRNARSGVLDVGAGTGRVTLMSLAESRVGVHAVEPARAMRAPLMTRLASLPPELRARVTIHAGTLDEAELHKVADVAVCHNTVACLDPAARSALWPAIARALVPGGSLLLQLPPAGLPGEEIVRVFPAQRVGRHEYGGRMVMSADGNRIRSRFDYWVCGAEGVLREHTETFWVWPTSRAEVIDGLKAHGFVPLPGRDDPTVLAVGLVGHGSGHLSASRVPRAHNE
ncbi:class I SAM-dependent methyltransferase [Streptomyces sp. NBC_00316]|uniref:class I SAM-dependent methyltransferase n=1 Tax=Streptomyces sp. NBC_00316 TaxID=2975710 RepID=UPI002E28A25A|nr:class I SAM-dependent methyltransferase [Streptomyces sp. NBC_00316]